MRPANLRLAEPRDLVAAAEAEATAGTLPSRGGSASVSAESTSAAGTASASSRVGGGGGDGGIGGDGRDDLEAELGSFEAIIEEVRRARE